MFKHILIPTDGSPLSIEAVKAGIRFCKETGARATVLTVTLPFPNSPLAEYAAATHAMYDAGMKKAADERLAVAAGIAREAGVTCATRAHSDWQPFLSIVQTADEEKCDAIFMASHGRRGIAGLLLGSETQKVLTHSKLPVVVYR
jgi:nucleotide-binding universal stress UspA family protein